MNLGVELALALEDRDQLRVHAELIRFVLGAIERIDGALGRLLVGFVEHGASVSPATRSLLDLGRMPELMVFSKHLAGPPLEESARRLREFGVGAIDITVRPKGHIAPEK